MTDKKKCPNEVCFCTGRCRMSDDQWERFQEFQKEGYKNKIDCLWDSLSEEEKNKPMGISCPCRKCSPWAL